MNVKPVSEINVYMEMEEANDIFAVNVGVYLMVQDIHVSPRALRKRRFVAIQLLET